MDRESNQSFPVQLPESMHEFVVEQTAATGHASTDEYVAALVLAEQRRKAQGELENLLLEGLASSERIEVTPEYWHGVRQEIQARLDAQRSS